MIDERTTTEKSSQRKAFLSSLATREKGVQLTLLIPAGLLVGWLVGTCLDHWLHTHWITIASVIAGAVAGFAQMIRVALRMMR